MSENEYNHTPCFTKVNKIRCAKGKYHKQLINAWEEYDRQKTSENDHPSCFTSDQLYLIIEMEHGGEELESYVFTNAKSAYYAFLQVRKRFNIFLIMYTFENGMNNFLFYCCSWCIPSQQQKTTWNSSTEIFI